jgi:toxin ParE1/3/4
MAGYRLTHAAQADIVSLLAWTDEQFGADARERYATLIVTAIRNAASSRAKDDRSARPELGEGVFSWHLAQSRDRVVGKAVRNPRHLLLCRREDNILVVGRVLHDAMAPRRWSSDS